jgi:hypothetical protein
MSRRLSWNFLLLFALFSLTVRRAGADLMTDFSDIPVGESWPAGLNIDTQSNWPRGASVDKNGNYMVFTQTSNEGALMWDSRDRCPIVWTARPAGLSFGDSYVVEASVMFENAQQIKQTIGLTWYGDVDGSLPTAAYAYSHWYNGPPRASFQILGNLTSYTDSYVSIASPSDRFFLRVVV